VALTAVPIAFATLTGEGPVWLGLNWAAWAVLWFVYWLLLALGMSRLLRFSGVLTIIVGIVTAWIPGYLLLTGALTL
jgi:hypothetical protein